jgi:hypothetical protein
MSALKRSLRDSECPRKTCFEEQLDWMQGHPPRLVSGEGGELRCVQRGGMVKQTGDLGGQLALVERGRRKLN